jgi:hypothetical protein
LKILGRTKEFWRFKKVVRASEREHMMKFQITNMFTITINIQSTDGFSYSKKRKKNRKKNYHFSGMAQDSGKEYRRVLKFS